jgi:GNAT superfamily N-acetyltransferase
MHADEGRVQSEQVRGGSGNVVVREVPADDADAHRLVQAYFAELRERLGGFDAPSFDELRADGTVFVASAAAPIACAWLRLLASDTAEVKRMYVAPEARGRGVARALLATLEARARSLGCTRIVLDTASPLVEAARLYLREGYAEIDRYNDNPYAARWFSKAL